MFRKVTITVCYDIDENNELDICEKSKVKENVENYLIKDTFFDAEGYLGMKIDVADMESDCYLAKATKKYINGEF